jgi:hypothetical protein
MVLLFASLLEIYYCIYKHGGLEKQNFFIKKKPEQDGSRFYYRALLETGLLSPPWGRRRGKASSNDPTQILAYSLTLDVT